jgi:hypothetical protein
MKLPAKVEVRIAQNIKKLQAKLIEARKRDINEADTAFIVADVLSEVLGYKKLEEITAEHAIKGTFADLAVRVGKNVRFLVEVKAINIELKDGHVTQVVNYAANLPCDWVVLTNGLRWKAYKVSFTKPIDRILVMDLDLSNATPKGPEVVEFFGSLSREVFTQSSMLQMFQARQAMSTYSIAALLVSDPVVAIVRRELRKLADGLNPNIEHVRTIIEDQIIKRELFDAEEAKLAAKAVRKIRHQAKAGKAIPDKTRPPVDDGTAKEETAS